MWFAHFRSFVARHRVVYWSVVGALALTVSLTLVAQSRQAVRERDSWGSTEDVWVAAVDVAPGAVIAAEPRTVPTAMVPQRAVSGAWPAGSVARQHVSSGEIVVDHDLGTSRLTLLPRAWRAVAVAADDSTITLEVGDRVDITASGAVLAVDGVVVDVRAAAVTVGVIADAAPAVADAALQRTAVVVLRAG
jgi:hypothetical protein